MVTAVLLSCLLSGTAGAQQAVATFSLRDHLKRNWQHELVFFPVEKNVFGREDVVLVGPEEKPVAYQWIPAELAPSETESIAFCASVPEFGRSVYRLVKGNPVKATDLRVAETKDSASVQNGFTGISLGGPKALQSGPIAGIRLRSGRWVGGGELKSPIHAETCTVKVITKGPVLTDVQVSYDFPQPCFWRLKFRLIAGDPVILVDEQFTLPKGASYALELGKGWGPDMIFYRGLSDSKTAKLGAAGSGPFFLLKPWPFWWGKTPEGNWFAAYRTGGDDLLAVGCREPGVWVEPGKTVWDTAVPIAKPQVRANFQLRGFARKWMLAALSKAESLTDKKAFAPLPQQYLIKHGDLPLDRVKDYVMEWDDRATRHPRLFVTKPEHDRFKKSFPVDKDRLAALRQSQINPNSMDGHVAYFLATGDKELGRNIATMAVGQLQRTVDEFVRQDTLRTHGTAPHHRTRPVYWSAIGCDLALAPSILSPQQRTRVKAQLAYLGYTMASPTFHSPERGYKANPNMTTTARGMLGIVACTIPKHPQARNWAQLAVAEMQNELETWCDSNGGWLEAPHYMTVSMDAIVPLAIALRETGFSEVEWHDHPKLKATFAWLAKIATPPDPRLGGNRHSPAIGNTYLGERTCLAGWAARMWRDKDPQFAQNMQWMWKAQGSVTKPGIGGAYPGLEGYVSIVLDPSITATRPNWGTELFPETGAVFRAHFPSDRETYLHYIQGRMHQHYDFDEGSFILWGKGQPLCEDFGYYGRAPAADHSRVDDGFYEALGVEGKIQQFAAGARADYLRGERAGWHRQILFLKDDDPLGPNYFLVRDSVLSGRAADWRLYIATDEPPPVTANPVRAKGRFEADLAVFFIDPARPRISAQSVTRTASASGFKSRESTQHCLHVKMPAKQPVATVLYPLMKDQKTPKFTSLAGGRGVKIENSYGTDYVFLALESFQFSGEGVEFKGKAGAVQIRPKSVRLSLPCRGRLSCRGKTIENPGGTARSVSR